MTGEPVDVSASLILVFQRDALRIIIVFLPVIM